MNYWKQLFPHGKYASANTTAGRAARGSRWGRYLKEAGGSAVPDGITAGRRSPDEWAAALLWRGMGST